MFFGDQKNFFDQQRSVDTITVGQALLGRLEVESRMRLTCSLLIASSLALLVAPKQAAGDLHTWDINEIFSSADGTIQFIEMQERGGLNNEHRWATSFAFPNHWIKSNTQQKNFTTNLPSTATANKFALIATSAFAALPGAVTPDYIIPSGFFSINGDTLNFANVDTFTFLGSQLPKDGVHSLLDTFANPSNSPTNFAGQVGSINIAVLGDMDGDGDLDNFDIQPFELALTDPAQYLSDHPLLTDYEDRGDAEGDNDFDNFDIQPFESLLTGGGAAVVPEPSAFVLSSLGILVLVGSRRAFRRRP